MFVLAPRTMVIPLHYSNPLQATTQDAVRLTKYVRLDDVEVTNENIFNGTNDQWMWHSFPSPIRGCAGFWYRNKDVQVI